MNILVTGSNGQLGTHMRRFEKESLHKFFFTDIEELDICDEESVGKYVAENNINAVVNCAAYTNVDKAEEEESVADKVNHLAVGILARAMKKVDGLLIHVSTDYVFGGGGYNTPCTEEVPANPTGAYGRTKLNGEKAIMDTGCRYVIIRTAWLYSEYGKNFLKTMMKVLEENDLRKVVFDQVGSPTYAGDLADAIYKILNCSGEEIKEGVYHFSNEGVCSWYDFAKEIGYQIHNERCEILPCHSGEFPSKVIRPSFSVLDKTKIKETFGVSVPYWKDSLERCIMNINKEK